MIISIADFVFYFYLNAGLRSPIVYTECLKSKPQMCTASA